MRELLTMTLSESDRLLAAADAGASLDGGSGGAGLEHDADQIAELEKRQDRTGRAMLFGPPFSFPIFPVIRTRL